MYFEHLQAITIFIPYLCHPFHEAGLIALGKFLYSNKHTVTYDDVIFRLEKVALPDLIIKQRLETVLGRIMKKLHRLKHCNIHPDKLNFFMSQSKVHIGKQEHHRCISSA